MKRHLVTALFAAFSATALAQAQVPAPTDTAAARYQDGVRLQAKGDERGAFMAFLESAEGGYAPAQRRMGEIYDSSRGAVVRDYPESIRWYQRAREGGEPVPQQKPRMQGLVDGR